MAKWNYSINIKLHLNQENSTEGVVRAAKGVLSEIKRLPSSWLDCTSTDYDCELDDIRYNLEDIITSKYDPEEYELLLEDFNYNVLMQLYDWADYHRVWLGN